MTSRRIVGGSNWHVSTILDRAELACVVLLVVATPTVFHRGTFSTFDVLQVTILWLSTITLGLVVLVRRFLFKPGVRLSQPVVIAASVFLTSLGLNMAFSPQPWVAFTGLSVRGAGTLTYSLCLLVLLVVHQIVVRRGPTTIVAAFLTAHAVVAGYALLQAYGGDPFEWGEGELWVSPVFSTLGNPNFSAAYLSLTLPLVAWMSLGPSNSRGTRVSGGALLGATAVAIAYLNSFQGDVAALVSVAVFANWVWYRVRGGRLLAMAIASPAALAVVCVPLLIQQPGRAMLAALAAGLAVMAWLSMECDRRYPTLVDPVAIRWTRRRILLASSSVGVVVAVAIMVVGGRVADELRSGLGQRVEFWRTSLSIFREHPILGTGLETYPAYFTMHRPVAHAVDWEFVLSDSPHSVPLGLLSGGGLLIAGSYAALVGLIGWIGYRAFRRTGGPTRLLALAILTAWIAYQVQSLVSMDMPGLIATQWIFGGALLAMDVMAGTGSDTVVADRVPRIGGAVVNRMLWWRWLGVCLATVAWLVSLGPVTAPFRADLAAGRAQKALDKGDIQAGGNHLLRAIELQPRRSLYADGMALVYSESGLHDLSYEELARSADLQPGNPFAAVQAAQAAIRIGQIDPAAAWYQRAVVDGPHQAGVLADAAAFNAAIGRVERSRELLASFEALESPNTSAWQVAKETYVRLGDIGSADRATLCATAGQVGCWPDG